MQKNDAVVIIPTYNEKENIEAILRAVTGLEEHGFDVLVIDDGSPDGTAAIVKQLMAGDLKDRVHLVERQGKLGLGTAYIAGSNGHSNTTTNTSLRWMLTSVTILRICLASTTLALWKVTT